MSDREERKTAAMETFANSAPEAAAAARARLFWNGRSQAVRLPKEFRFEGDEVSIRREGRSIILEPVDKPGWPAGYWERIDTLTRDFRFPDIEPVGGRLIDVPFGEDP